MTNKIWFSASLVDLGNGIILVLEVKHGLPFRILVAEAAA